MLTETTARAVVRDLVEGDRAKALLNKSNLEILNQKKIIKNLSDKIRDYEALNSNLETMASNALKQAKLMENTADEYRKLSRKYRRHRNLTWIGGGAVILLILLL